MSDACSTFIVWISAGSISTALIEFWTCSVFKIFAYQRSEGRTDITIPGGTSHQVVLEVNSFVDSIWLKKANSSLQLEELRNTYWQIGRVWSIDNGLRNKRLRWMLIVVAHAVWLLSYNHYQTQAEVPNVLLGDDEGSTCWHLAWPWSIVNALLICYLVNMTNTDLSVCLYHLRSIDTVHFWSLYSLSSGLTDSYFKSDLYTQPNLQFETHSSHRTRTGLSHIRSASIPSLCNPPFHASATSAGVSHGRLPRRALSLVPWHCTLCTQ